MLLFLLWDYPYDTTNIVFNVYHKVTLDEPWSLYEEDIVETWISIDATLPQEFFTVTASNTVTQLESEYAHYER